MGVMEAVDLVDPPVVMLQPDVVLPSQHFAPYRKLAAEYRLMIAVLQDAIACIAKYRYAAQRRGQRLFYDEAQWFLSDATDSPYSFEHICDVLGLDSNAVRRGIRLA